MIAEVLKNNFSPTCYYYYKQNFVFVKGAILKKSEKSMEEKRRRRIRLCGKTEYFVSQFQNDWLFSVNNSF